MQPQVALQELLTRVLARQLTRNADEVSQRVVFVVNMHATILRDMH